LSWWQSVELSRRVQLRLNKGEARNEQSSSAVDAELLQYLSPLGWEHINLTGDYQWRDKMLAQNRFRPLRIQNPA
jgi:hypothetical protein